MIKVKLCEILLNDQNISKWKAFLNEIRSINAFLSRICLRNSIHFWVNFNWMIEAFLRQIWLNDQKIFEWIRLIDQIIFEWMIKAFCIISKIFKIWYSRLIKIQDFEIWVEFVFEKYIRRKTFLHFYAW